MLRVKFPFTYLQVSDIFRHSRCNSNGQVDTSGDGFIDIKEFERLLEHPRLQLWLHQLEIETMDLVGLFNMLDDGDAWQPDSCGRGTWRTE